MLKKRIFIDCTDVVLRRQCSGIQRVIKSLYVEYKKMSSDADFDVHAVFLDKGKFNIIHLESLIDNSSLPGHNKRKNHFRFIFESLLKYIPYQVIYFLHKKLLKLKLDQRILGEELNIKKDDIIILADSSWRMNIWKSLYNAKKNKAKIVAVVHDLIPINHKEYVRSCYTKIFNQWLSGLYNLTDDFVCVSESVKNDLIRFYKSKGLNINNKHFNSFTLGANLKSTEVDSAEISKDIIDLYKKKNSIYLIVSTIEPRKNHDYLLDVFDELWVNGLDIVLCIVGKDIGTSDKTVKKIKKHDQLNKKLFMFNNLNDDEVLYCYKNSKALLLPSIAEGFGLPIVESLSLSLPVLASNIAVFHEIAGESIHYFDITNSADLVLKLEKIEKNELSLKINTIFKKTYSWEDSARELLNKIQKGNSFE